MKINFLDVINFLDLNISQKYEESAELLDSIFFISSEASCLPSNDQFGLDYFLVYEKNIQVYFSRIKNILFKIINFPMKIIKLSESCGALLYSLLNLTLKIIRTFDRDCLDQEISSIGQYLVELKRVLSLIGSWRNLTSNHLDSKCCYKERSSIENVYSTSFHTVLSVQNICLYLVAYLTQISLAKKNYLQTSSYVLCSFVEEPSELIRQHLSEEEACIFIQNCHLFINNLVYAHLNQFKKNFNLSELDAASLASSRVFNSISNTLHCECISKCWYFAHRLMNSFDSNGYFTKTQNIFWQTFTRIVSKLKETDSQKENSAPQIDSDVIYFKSESKKFDNLSHFILLVNNDVINSIQSQYEQSNILPAQNFLDPGYQLMKSTIKEIIDQNQSTSKASMSKLFVPIQLLCHLIFKTGNSSGPNVNLSTSSQLSMSYQLISDSVSVASLALQKILGDLLTMLWETYFSKNLNAHFNLGSFGLSNSLDHSSQLEYRTTLQIINQICSQQSSETITNNIYHIFLKYLFLNLNDSGYRNPAHSSSIMTSSFNTSSSSGLSGAVTAAANMGSNAVWRQFRGRLYSRLGDKRLSELDLNGLLNLSYLFLVVLRSFTSSTSSSSLQNKLDVLKNFYHLTLNAFGRVKNLHKIDHVLALSSSTAANSSISMTTAVQAKVNTVKAIATIKFIALRLWFENSSSDLLDGAVDLSFDEEFETLFKLEFIDSFNSWLIDAIEIANKFDSLSTSTSANINQISSFKNSQLVSQFLSDLFSNCIDNCKYVLGKPNDSIRSIYQATYCICKLLDELKLEILFKILSRKQNELLFSILTELLMTLKRLIQNELKPFAINSSLSKLMSKLIIQLWEKLVEHQRSINISTVFSYEIMANIHLEICSLYSNLFSSSDQALMVSDVLSDEMRRLCDMIETFLHSNNSHDDYTQLTTVRIRFVNGILSDPNLFALSQKSIKQFEAKLVNLIISAYLNSNLVSSNKSTSSSEQSTSSTLVEKELNLLVSQCAARLEVFSEIDFIDNDLEKFINAFVKSIDSRLKRLQSLQERKPVLDNLNIYLQDFLRMIASITSISTHAIIYKCYLLAAQIISNLSVYLHFRGKSDSIFAKIIDKMVFPACLSKSTASSTTANAKTLSSSSVSSANNQNSLLMSLRDTLHLFLLGISRLNYDYDNYLQRVIQNVIINYTMKYQILKNEDHFLVLAIESSFSSNPPIESVQFRTYILKALKQSFLLDLKLVSDCEKCLSLVQYIFSRTESDDVVLNDAEIYFTHILVFIGNDNQALKNKALAMFSSIIKRISTLRSDSCNSVLSKSVENFVNTYWSQIEPHRIFISLCLIAKQKPSIISEHVKELILEKVEESQSKFRYNSELKNTLFTFFEYLSGDQGKVYLNKRLSFLLH